MVKVTDNTKRTPKVTYLADIPKGTFFTGNISGYDNKIFLKLGPKPSEANGDSMYGSDGYGLYVGFSKVSSLGLYACRC